MHDALGSLGWYWCKHYVDEYHAGRPNELSIQFREINPKCFFFSFFPKGMARLRLVLSTECNFGTWKITFFQTRHDSEKIKVWGRQKYRGFPYFAAGFHALATQSTPVRRIVYGSIPSWAIWGYSSTKVPKNKTLDYAFFAEICTFQKQFPRDFAFETRNERLTVTLIPMKFWKVN